jgi:hypothetical protein
VNVDVNIVSDRKNPKRVVWIIMVDKAVIASDLNTSGILNSNNTDNNVNNLLLRYIYAILVVLKLFRNSLCVTLVLS